MGISSAIQCNQLAEWDVLKFDELAKLELIKLLVLIDQLICYTIGYNC